MSKVLILVEGQAEETFVKRVLAPYLSTKGVLLIPKLATTKRVKSGTDFKGGIVSFGKTRNDILRLLKDTSAVAVTTLIDFYGLPTDFPGHKGTPKGSCYDRVAHLEQSFKEDVNHSKFIPYFAVHEFEAMLFVAPQYFAKLFPEKLSLSDSLFKIKSDFSSPEEIDEGPATAPSKRLLSLAPQYRKPLHGSIATADTGIEQIRKECPHFNEWLTKLESL